MPTLVDDVRKLITNETESSQAQHVIDEVPAGELHHWVAAQSSGQTVTLPRELSDLLTRILETVARGGTVTVGSMPEDVTTTTAADLLGVSRPTLMKMIGRDEIASHKVGSHTRLRSADVRAFKHDRLVRQRTAFRDLLALEDGD